MEEIIANDPILQGNSTAARRLPPERWAKIVAARRTKLGLPPEDTAAPSPAGPLPVQQQAAALGATNLSKPNAPEAAEVAAAAGAPATAAAVTPVQQAPAKTVRRTGGIVPKRKQVAVIYDDNCTGCEMCLAVCPVWCIFKVEDLDGTNNICEIEVDKCIGCQICFKECPWDAIRMVSWDEAMAMPAGHDYPTTRVSAVA